MRKQIRLITDLMTAAGYAVDVTYEPAVAGLCAEYLINFEVEANVGNLAYGIGIYPDAFLVPFRYDQEITILCEKTQDERASIEHCVELIVADLKKGQ